MKLKRKVTTEQTAELLKNSGSIALFAHTRPDGDTVGSCVALSFILRKMGKTADVFCDEKPDGAFCEFDEMQSVKNAFSGKYDLLVAVDCGDVFRLGSFAGVFQKHPKTLVIDHHDGQPYADFNCVRSYSSTAEIVFEIVQKLGVKPDESTATMLYMGLCTDTGNFFNDNTNAHSFAVASKLTELGADIQKVNRLFFKQTSFNQNKLLAKSLGSMRSYFDGKLCVIFAMKSDISALGLPFSATESLVSYAANVNTAVVGVSLAEHAENVFKVSFRGNDFDVRSIAEEFGGGGHLRAAGCMISGLFEDVVEKIVRTVERYL